MYSFGGYKNVNKIQHKKINLLLIINYYFRKLNEKKKMMKSSTKTRIRYSETDQMGVVYHGNYAQFFEMGRTEWLRSLGLSYKDMENSGLMLPVIAINFNFIKSALYDDVLTIHTFLKKEPLVKIEFTYEIKNQKNELICTGSSVLAFMQIKTMKPTRCPEYLLKGLGF